MIYLRSKKRKHINRLYILQSFEHRYITRYLLNGQRVMENSGEVPNNTQYCTQYLFYTILYHVIVTATLQRRWRP